ncbi:MAG: GNAT family N-acetyltransferase [Defluviitaleaceae bacterium]|nr:GNAT family N-acetyltransferase [Defluviitaleaceae bacterium]
MPVELVEITMKNFEECLNLTVNDWQLNFVAPNCYSLSEAYADKVSVPRAIYADGVMVGFIMYDYDADKQTGFITRLMVDKNHQKNGYGREAMEIVIGRLKETPGCKYIRTSYWPDNVNAGRLYEKLGFVKTGEISGGEAVCRITVS